MAKGKQASGTARDADTAHQDVQFVYSPSYGEAEPFTKPHTVGALLSTVALVVYALYTNNEASGITADPGKHIKWGLAAALTVGLTFCTEHLRDTLFIRPHPAIWRFVNGLGLFYTMALAFALFQPLPELRDMMVGLDPVHAKGRAGAALEQSYAEDCSFNLSSVWGAMDRFVAAHFVGWIFKAFMFRHVGIAMATSFIFELLEYTFEYLQPNFAECWWDHWILDFIVCNTGGIIAGHLLMDYFGSKEYSWVGITRVPTVTGKLSRLAAQFTPHHWTPYEWAVFSDLRRFLYVLAIVVGTMVIELDAFFLKYILRVQPASMLNVYRLVLWWAVGMVGLRDYYAFMTDARIKRLGATMWTCLAMCLMEFIVVLRFGSEEWASKRPPFIVVACWSTFLGLSLITGVWWFGYELPKRKASGERLTQDGVAAPLPIVGNVMSAARSAASAASAAYSVATEPIGSMSPSRFVSPLSGPLSSLSRAASAGMSSITSSAPASARKAATPRSPEAAAARELMRLGIDGTPALGGSLARQSPSPAKAPASAASPSARSRGAASVASGASATPSKAAASPSRTPGRGRTGSSTPSRKR